MIDFLFFIFFYIVVIVSTLGFGCFVIFFLKDKTINYSDFGIIGLHGIFGLIFLSYSTNIFFSHSLAHNIIVISLGCIFFLFYLFKKKKFVNEDFKHLFIVFGFLFLSFLVFKNHDDFHYYHFPYTLNLINNKIQFGMGNFGHGFRTPSSIFYLNSITYLPFIKYQLFNIGQLMIWGFVNLILIKEILSKKKINEFNFLYVLNLFSFVFINIIFYRLSEHGTDRSAQILIFILIIYILEFVNSNENYKEKFEKISVITVIIISLKAFYILYLILFIQVFLKILKNKISIYRLLKSKIVLASFLTSILFINGNFSNSGCVVYPIKETCFNNLKWSIDKKEVEVMNNWYELWSKGGAAPNYRVKNPKEYIEKFNWVSNWINKYFFTKVSDTLGMIIIFIILFAFLFKGKKRGNIKFDFKLTYLLILILFLEWFYNHPALRYGGFCLLALILFLPMCRYFSGKDLKTKIKRTSVYSLIILTMVTFALRNINRLYKENKQYNYNIIASPYYEVADSGFRIDKHLKLINEEYIKCNFDKKCDFKNGIILKKINTYNFYIRKPEE